VPWTTDGYRHGLLRTSMEDRALSACRRKRPRGISDDRGVS